ncbi:MAG: adenosylcobinamide-GDP ribazoletransferase [Clostridia bacterium]|nr:adenosylcobinamide-GDP ribazoletransferase [Clostridia bacterium]
MKKYLRALVMCFSMFCAIPCPIHSWAEESVPYISLFLPLVGAFVGGLWTLCAYVLRLLALPNLVNAAILCAFPFLITGGMHMDGFLDVTDAVKSRRPLEERRKILKDPHVGSFAVLSAILLIMGQFALFASAKEEANILALLIICVCSRCMAAAAVILLKPMKTSQYATAKTRSKVRALVPLLVLAAVVACGFVFFGKYGFVSLAVIAGYSVFAACGYRSLQGMSGDISGYALTLAELCGVAVYALI